VVLKIPPVIGDKGFGYYDARMNDERFQYFASEIDSKDTALTMTISLANEGLYDHVAWND